MKLLIILLLIFFVLALLIFAESVRECKMLKLTEYEIDTKGVFSSFNPAKIALISDFHNCFLNDADVIFDKLKKEKPDVIILAGDMILSHSDQIGANKKTAKFINTLSRIAPVYFGMGNHETAVAERERLKKLWPHFINEFSGRVHLLRNSSAKIKLRGRSVNIYGLELADKYYERFSKLKPTVEEIYNLMAKNDKGDYDILIAHNPDFFNVYENWGADLVLSGHNHGGMVRIPILGGIISPKPAIFPKFDYGLYKQNDTIMIVSSGLGAHSIMIRVNNVPELVIIKLL